MIDSTTSPSCYHPPTGILESVLYCDDLEACGWFYEEVIGLSLISSQLGRHRFYQLGHSMLLIFCRKATMSDEVKVGGETIPKHGTRGEGHLAFSTPPEAAAAIRDRLQSFGIQIEAEIPWPGGGLSIYCRDPAGNSIEFATPKIWFREM